MGRVHLLLWLLAILAVGCASSEPVAAPILLFDGHGTSPGDVAALEEILRANGFGYSTANSSQLNSISESQLKAYQLLVVPGGNFEVMGNSITPGTAAKIRTAVGGGLGYLGICA